MVWLARTGAPLAGPAWRVRLLEDGGQPFLPLAPRWRVPAVAGRGPPARRCLRGAGLAVPLRRRQRGPCPPARRRRPPPARTGGPERGTWYPPDQALGRSRGGLGTKLHLRVEGRGRPLVILATAGQRHEAPLLPALLDAGAVKRSGSDSQPGRGRPRRRPVRLVADKGYSYPSVRAALRRRGIAAVIRPGPTSAAGLASTGRPTASATGWSAAWDGSSSSAASLPVTRSWPSTTWPGSPWPPP
jgi:hypothetical protein